jgi:hypothetical protein
LKARRRAWTRRFRACTHEFATSASLPKADMEADIVLRRFVPEAVLGLHAHNGHECGKHRRTSGNPCDARSRLSVIIDGTEHVYRCGYFTRLSTSSTTPPPDPAGLLHFISSPVTVIVLGCSAPIQFGNVLFSILSVKVLSATE